MFRKLYKILLSNYQKCSYGLIVKACPIFFFYLNMDQESGVLTIVSWVLQEMK